MKTHLLGIICSLGLLGALRSFADTEEANFTYVTTSTTDVTMSRGDRYAKCIPDGISGTNGVTKIYLVGKEQDVLEHTYDWYANAIYLSGTGIDAKTAVVRLGPWNQGYRANTNDMALAFYFDGRLLKSYSTLDIAGRPDNVSTSISHYTWYQRVGGYGWVKSASSPSLIYGFTLKTKDGRTLCFNVKSGELVRDGKPEFGE